LLDIMNVKYQDQQILLIFELNNIASSRLLIL